MSIPQRPQGPAVPRFSPNRQSQSQNNRQSERRELQLSPVRSAESVSFDNETVRIRGGDSVKAPPFRFWPDFYRYMESHWNADDDYGAEHVIVVGQAGSGKTTVARELLRQQPYVVVLGTKNRDPSLYDPLEKQGYEIVDKFNPADLNKPKVIFRPQLEEPTPEALEKQRVAFHRALLGIYKTGGWTIFCDELRYLTDTLHLSSILDTLWLQGRSEWITIVGLTQRPVSVPLNAFEQATHFILFRISGFDDRKRASEYTGANAPVVHETVKRLPKHEFLYVDKVNDVLMRSKVDR